MARAFDFYLNGKMLLFIDRFRTVWDLGQPTVLIARLNIENGKVSRIEFLNFKNGNLLNKIC